MLYPSRAEFHTSIMTSGLGPEQQMSAQPRAGLSSSSSNYSSSPRVPSENPIRADSAMIENRIMIFGDENMVSVGVDLVPQFVQVGTAP